MILSKYFVAKGSEWDLLAIPSQERKSKGTVSVVVIILHIMMLCQVRVSQVLQGLDTPSAN